MKVVIIEPYYGGSHKSFWDGMALLLPHDFILYTLPARKWKWRMRLAAPYFADLFRSDPEKLKGVDRILCSPFLDVAAFKGLLPEEMPHIPILTYFHENQFVYPVRIEDERDIHFALTNMTTALASDRIAFNSNYNFQTFMKGAEDVLEKIYDIELEGWVEAVRKKTVILNPALDFTELDQLENKKCDECPVIVWNHRWEHDKNPDLFFHAISELENIGLNFKIIVLGESFQTTPEIFAHAKDRFKDKIIHFGYVKSRREYLSYLKLGDIVVSTARHEFYGISVIEAVRAGCRPLLPDALSYPELFPDIYLYKEEQLVEKLAYLVRKISFSLEKGRQMTDRFSWQALLPSYQKWLCDDCI